MAEELENKEEGIVELESRLHRGEQNMSLEYLDGGNVDSQLHHSWRPGREGAR